MQEERATVVHYPCGLCGKQRTAIRFPASMVQTVQFSECMTVTYLDPTDEPFPRDPRDDALIEQMIAEAKKPRCPECSQCKDE